MKYALQKRLQRIRYSITVKSASLAKIRRWFPTSTARSMSSDPVLCHKPSYLKESTNFRAYLLVN